MRDIPECFDLKKNSDVHGLACKDKSRAQQSDLKDADINEIVRKFGLTATIPVGFRLPEYGDFSGVGDFRTAMDAVRNAQENFDSLPAELRARFGNNPQLLLEFVSNAENKDEAIKLGLVNKPADVMKVPGVDTPMLVKLDSPAEPAK